MFEDVSTINEFARDFYARSLTIDSAFRQIFRSWLSDDVRSMFDSFEIISPVGETEIPYLNFFEQDFYSLLINLFNISIHGI